MEWFCSGPDYFQNSRFQFGSGSELMQSRNTVVIYAAVTTLTVTINDCESILTTTINKQKNSKTSQIFYNIKRLF